MALATLTTGPSLLMVHLVLHQPIALSATRTGALTPSIGNGFGNGQVCNGSESSFGSPSMGGFSLTLRDNGGACLVMPLAGVAKPRSKISTTSFDTAPSRRRAGLRSYPLTTCLPSTRHLLTSGFLATLTHEAMARAGEPFLEPCYGNFGAAEIGTFSP